MASSDDQQAKRHDVWITGIGIVTCFGEGVETHWQTLAGEKAPAAIQDTETFKPYAVHPLPEIDWSQQVSRKDARQMETWQRLGTYAAGMALDDAGLKGDEELVSSMDLVVCAGGGERDIQVDEMVLREARQRNDREMVVNERLPVELRPTLFLAQLSNLMAGNISIVHKVTGSSRTYMGEESCGVTALRDAFRRISHGQSTHMLVGGAYNSERPDLLLNLELGNHLLRGSTAPVFERQSEGGGMIPGTAGVFLVLESAEHAKARDVTPYAKLSGVASDLGPRDKDSTLERVKRMMDELDLSNPNSTAVLSGSTGCTEITDWEFEAIRTKVGMESVIRAFTSLTGNPIEANFPLGVALAAMALKNGDFYPPFEPAENPAKIPPNQILVSCLGHYRGEGMAMIDTAS